jgi:hypothetical protein
MLPKAIQNLQDISLKLSQLASQSVIVLYLLDSRRSEKLLFFVAIVILWFS